MPLPRGQIIPLDPSRRRSVAPPVFASGAVVPFAVPALALPVADEPGIDRPLIAAKIACYASLDDLDAGTVAEVARLIQAIKAGRVDPRTIDALDAS